MPVYTTQLDLLRAVTTGDLNTDTLNVAGTITATPTGTQDVNLKQVSGTTASVNNGTADAGTQRVAVASDNTPFGIKITDGTNTNTIKLLSTQVVAADYGIVTNTVIHGLTTAGGGSYVDVKVNPSGALSTSVGDISGVTGQATMANSLPVVIASNQSAVPASQSGTWILGANSGVDIGDVTINNAAGASAVNIQDGGNTITVDGTVSAAQSGTWTVQPGNTANTTPWLVTGSASSSVGGLTQHKTDALVATATSVKASAGQVYGYHISNQSSADAYLHFYNIASGSVTVGSSTRTRTIFIPQGGVIDSAFAFGLTFSTAITIAATTTITGSSAPSVGLLVMVDYV